MDVLSELEAIREANDGILRPTDVLEFARDPNTALHGRFTWDDSEAAEQYRLWQARRIIQVHVVIPEPTQKRVRAYVSLTADRAQPGGGYRHLSDVMGDHERRQQLLKQALREANAWRARYKALQELAPVFDALDEIVLTPSIAPLPEKALNLVA